MASSIFLLLSWRLKLVKMIYISVFSQEQPLLFSSFLGGCLLWNWFPFGRSGLSGNNLLFWRGLCFWLFRHHFFLRSFLFGITLLLRLFGYRLLSLWLLGSYCFCCWLF